jgi:hypothetical protein
MTWDEQEYSDKELERYLQEWYDEHGKKPTQSEFSETEGVPNAKLYYTRFGSWADAKDEFIDE